MTSRCFLLDTTALLAHYLDEPGSEEVQRILEDDDARVIISTLSVAEVSRRVQSLGVPASEARDVALTYLNLCDEAVSVDAAVALRAFELGSTAAARVPLVDALIAASALLCGAVLMHRDCHFASMASVPQRSVLEA